MRIIRGILKTKRITVPKGFPSRPTTDFAKEGLFNMLENKISFIDLNILDLCAGTGNISFEFASREAGYITAVDSNFNSFKHINRCIYDFGLKDVMRCIKGDVVKFLEKTNDTYDLIFADPPYEVKFHEEILAKIKERNLLNEGGLVIIEHGKRTDLSKLEGYEDSRSFGNVVFSFFK